MSREQSLEMVGSFPRPGPALKAVLFALFSVWLGFALTVNWAPEPLASGARRVFFLLAGSTSGVLNGELWRLMTAPLLHAPNELGHIAFTLLGLYFLSPSLEAAWGSRRFLWFVFGAGAFAYTAQLLVVLALPAGTASRLVGPAWFGAMPVVEAIAIAWAMSFRGRTVNLFFVLPVSSRTLVLFVVGMSILAVIVAQPRASGLVSPFGGMLAGWLFGDEPSPIRRFWLKRRLRSHERELDRLHSERRRRVKSSHLQVIRGGASDDGEPEPPGSDGGSTPGGRSGRWLN